MLPALPCLLPRVLRAQEHGAVQLEDRRKQGHLGRRALSRGRLDERHLPPGWGERRGHKAPEAEPWESLKKVPRRAGARHRNHLGLDG